MILLRLTIDIVASYNDVVMHLSSLYYFFNNTLLVPSYHIHYLHLHALPPLVSFYHLHHHALPPLVSSYHIHHLKVITPLSLGEGYGGEALT